MRWLWPALLVGPAIAAEHQISGALVVNPAGLYARYDYRVPVGGGLHVGVFDTWLVYANGVGAQVQWRSEPAWFETHLDLSAEPGWYLMRPDGARVGAGIDGDRDAGERDFGWRYQATWQTNVNIQTADWWLYGRTTALARYRDFVEADVFQEMQVDTELSIEQATAIMRRLAGGGDGAGLWLYAEYTVGGVVEVGTRPNRVSGGLILERWPTRGATLNLDAFYSLAEAPLDGPGGIFAWWFRW